MPEDIHGSPDERSLIRKARWGNESALETLYQRHARAIHGHIYRMTGNHALAEDLTQDTFIKLLSFRARIDPQRPLRPWLKRVASNAVIDHLRRNSRLTELDEESGVHLEASTHGANEALDKLALQDALRRLPTLTRTVIWMHEVEGWSHREIADHFGYSESWSKSLVSRGLKHLGAVVRDET